MAIAHVCLGCGFDLARQRAVVEPHYQLPLIHCPRCQRPAVRVRHPLIGRWRGFARAEFAIGVLGFQILIIIALTAVTLFSCFGMVIVFWQVVTGAMGVDAGWFILWPLALVGPLTGMWLTAGLAHLPRWRVWTGWFVWIALWITLIAMELGLYHGLPPGAAASVQHHDDAAPLAQQLPGIMVVIALPALGGFAAMLASAAVLGVPLGLAVRALLGWMQRQVWRLRLRRLRRARSM